MYTLCAHFKSTTTAFVVQNFKGFKMTVTFRNDYDFQSAKLLPANQNEALQARKSILTLGFPCLNTVLQHILGDGTEDVVSLQSMDELTNDKLDELRPNCIVSPLFGQRIDIIALADFLQTHGFDGVLSVVGPRVPKPHMVRAEIQTICPDIEVELYVPRRVQATVEYA